jgi:hypothetical protein
MVAKGVTKKFKDAGRGGEGTFFYGRSNMKAISIP